MYKPYIYKAYLVETSNYKSGKAITASVMVNILKEGGCMTFWDFSGFVKWSLAQAQRWSEAVIAAEHLHQRALEGNAGIKMGTAGTCRRAGGFFFFFFLH